MAWTEYMSDKSHTLNAAKIQTLGGTSRRGQRPRNPQGQLNCQQSTGKM